MKKLFRFIFLPFAKGKDKLESKWWHRLIKVSYILAIISFFFYRIDHVPDKFTGLLLYNPPDPALFTESVRADNLETIVLTYLISLALQFFYYKIFLYIIYGKNGKNSAPKFKG